MDVQTAKETIYRLENSSSLSKEDAFLLVESYQYVIEQTGDPEMMLYLGGHYYGEKNFVLAKKYYEMSASLGDVNAYGPMGYIYYYGRVGNPDYEKAYYWYRKAAKSGDLEAELKLADMSKNGYYVPKDYEAYKKQIEALYDKVKTSDRLGDPFPEAATRLASIRTEEGKIEEAISLYLEAKNFLAQRIHYNPFFGNLHIMMWLEDDLNALLPVDTADFDFFDCYILLKEPTTIAFSYGRKRYQVTSKTENGQFLVSFLGKSYPSVASFMEKAAIPAGLLCTLGESLSDFEVTNDE
jgi:hypothetical protein